MSTAPCSRRARLAGSSAGRATRVAASSSPQDARDTASRVRRERPAATRPPAAARLGLRSGALVDPYGVPEVGVALEEGEAGGLVGVRPGVPEHVEPVADVDDVDEPVPDDWIAPHDDLVGP